MQVCRPVRAKAFKLQLIELRESLHAVFVIHHAAGFTATVHGENGITHVHALQWDGRGEDIAQSAATCYIAVVYETLARNTGSLTDIREDGSRYRICAALNLKTGPPPSIG